MNQFKPLLFWMIFLFVEIQYSSAQEKSPFDTMSCQTALQCMFDSIYHLKNAEFEMVSYERIEGVLKKNHATVIIQYSPRKIFLRGYNEANEIGNEILYVEGENNNDALISPSGFPFFNLNLNPLGSLMRKGRHLTLLDAGGRYLVDMLKVGMKQSGENIRNSERFQITRDSVGFTKLVVNNLDYHFIPYTVKPNDDIRKLCFELGVPEYKILEINDAVDDYDDITEGQIILIPNIYAKRFEITIREFDFVPVLVKIFDDKGLFSAYQYLSFNAKPNLTNQTFSEDNPAYSF